MDLFIGSLGATSAYGSLSAMQSAGPRAVLLSGMLGMIHPDT